MPKYRYCTSSACSRKGRPYSGKIGKRYNVCHFCGAANPEVWEEELERYTVYTDGSCLDNVNGGAGGWAAVIIKDFEFGQKPFNVDHSRVVKTLTGGHPHTTNNRMELQGIIEVLETGIEKYSSIEFVSDSQYTVNGCSEWVFGWYENGWVRGAKKEPIKNRDMWEKVHLLLSTNYHEATFRWVKGHSGNPYNELVDIVAKETANSFL
jgi:ribonuclease HI